ncbi:MAG: O-antigen ligase family protein [Ruminococcus sp.]|nr:O-antigen ligase family protein [Ruminococcus sp.]
MKITIKKPNPESIFYLFIAVFMSQSGIMTLTSFLIKNNTLKTAANFLVYAVILVLFLMSAGRFFKRIKLNALAVLACGLLLAVFTYFFSPGSAAVFKEESLWKSVFYSSMSVYLLMQEVEYFDLFFDVYKKFSYFMVCLAVVVFLISPIGNGYMGYSYSFLLNVMILLYAGMFKGDKAALVFGIIGTGVDILGGTRGSIICLAGLLGAYLLLSRKWKTSAILVILLGCFAVNMDLIINLLGDFVKMIGLNSRIVDALKGDNMTSIAYSNGRGIITEASMKLIAKNPWGYGFLGERVELNNAVVWFKTNGYSHNIFTELWLQFGVVLGTVAIGFLLFYTVKMIIGFDKSNALYSLGIVLFCYNLHLLVSRSYTISFSFWAYIAVLVMLNFKTLKGTKRRIIWAR